MKLISRRKQKNKGKQQITRNRDICGGKACIKGTRIRVIDIVERYLFLRENPEDIATAYDISVSWVFAALWYYYENLAEMRDEMNKDKELITRLRGKIEQRQAAYAT